MRDAERWQPGKFELRDGRWRASRDPTRLAVTSRLAGELQATAYSEMIARYATGDLLDLGCGFVPLYGCYRSLTDSVTCADWPNTLHPSPHLDLEADLTQPLALESEAYDTVILSDVLEHIPVPDVTMSEVARLLRSGGHVIIGVPFIYGLHEEPFDFHRYTKHRLRMLCDDHGLAVKQLRCYGDNVHAILDLVIKFLGPRLPGEWFVRTATALGTRRRPRPDADTPLGYVVVAQKGPGQ